MIFPISISSSRLSYNRTLLPPNSGCYSLHSKKTVFYIAFPKTSTRLVNLYLNFYLFAGRSFNSYYSLTMFSLSSSFSNSFKVVFLPGGNASSVSVKSLILFMTRLLMLPRLIRSSGRSVWLLTAMASFRSLMVTTIGLSSTGRTL